MEQDTNIMLHHKEVESPTSMHLEEEKVSNYQGGIEILRDQLEEKMHNITFDESQHRVM